MNVFSTALLIVSVVLGFLAVLTIGLLYVRKKKNRARNEMKRHLQRIDVAGGM
jgi:LPXTG-motif cell wall-anchored protein